MAHDLQQRESAAFRLLHDHRTTCTKRNRSSRTLDAVGVRRSPGLASCAKERPADSRSNRERTARGQLRTVIVGTGRAARNLAARLRASRDGRVFEGFLDDYPEDGVSTLGRVLDLERLALTLFLDEVIICSPRDARSARTAVFLARRLGLDVRLVAETYGCDLTAHAIEMAGETPMLTLQRGTSARSGITLKRLLDVMAAAAALLVLMPVLLLIGLLVKLDSSGPALYSAPRVGKRGRFFVCHKFRTMCADADTQKQRLLAQNERKGAFFKMRKDPRITGAGGWLRRYSLDELPQLWNVLRGEMSLVGPRPHPVDDHAQYSAAHYQRLTVTPGLTGLWQVTARNDPSFERSVELDRQYIQKQSWRLDLWILFRTVRAVAVGNGV